MAFQKIVGEVLRGARAARGLTLQDVHQLSRGRFKPSALGGYERGERLISLSRFCALAECYRIPADRLLSDVLRLLHPQARTSVVLDTRQLRELQQPEQARAASDFVHRVKVQRGDYISDVISLRAGDLEVISLDAGSTPGEVLKALDPAVRAREGSDHRMAP